MLLDLQELKVTKVILVKMVALAFLVRWAPPGKQEPPEKKETKVHLARLELKAIQVLKAFQAPRVIMVMLDLLEKLELTENLA